MRETRQSGSEGGVERRLHPYPYSLLQLKPFWFPAFAGMTGQEKSLALCDSVSGERDFSIDLFKMYTT